VAYEQVVLPRFVRDGAVLHCPGNLVPLPPWRPPTSLVVQNPNLFGTGRRLPHNRRWRRRLQAATARRSVRSADAVIAVSEAMMAEIRADVPDLGNRGVVVQSGAPSWPADTEAFARELPPQGYVLSVANDAPHKRLDDLVEAWASAFPTSGPGLVLVGHVAPRPHRDGVVYAGPVSDQRVLRGLVEGALVMVSTSALEAHPHTPAVAGALGCPLILSDIPPHREVAGEHPLAYVPVGDVGALAAALRAAAADPTRRPWAWPITWDDHARELVAVWESLV